MKTVACLLVGLLAILQANATNVSSEDLFRNAHEAFIGGIKDIAATPYLDGYEVNIA